MVIPHRKSERRQRKERVIGLAKGGGFGAKILCRKIINGQTWYLHATRGWKKGSGRQGQ